MKVEELCTLLRAVADTGVESFTYEESGVKVSIQGKKAEEKQTVILQGQAGMQPAFSMMPGTVPVAVNQAAGQVAGPMTAGPVENAAPQEGSEIKSPLVGIFYAAPSEEAEPFVKVGDAVKKGQTIAIVEAMKLMNEIEAEADGVITEILVKNAQAVEFGQPLFRIRQ